jgi:hypothetical protein
MATHICVSLAPGWTDRPAREGVHLGCFSAQPAIFGEMVGELERCGGPPSPQPSDKRRSKLRARGSFLPTLGSKPPFSLAKCDGDQKTPWCEWRRNGTGLPISGKHLSYDAAAGQIRAVCWRAWLARGAGGGDSGKEVARLGPQPCRCWPIQFNAGVSGLSLR